MAKIFIPSIGVAMEEALLVKWLKQPGEQVEAEEAVAEIETDKAAMDLTSPVRGSLGPHLFEPGAIIPVGTTIAEVLEEGQEGSHDPSQPEDPVTHTEVVVAQTPPLSQATAASGRTPHALSPRARHAAQEREVEAVPQADRFGALIAAKVADSWREIPHFTVTREVDAEPMIATLAHLRASTSESTPTLTDLFLRALALGLSECFHPCADDVGLAVATDFGVVIPVVRDVISMDALSLAGARRAAVERARRGRLSPEDLAEPPPSTLSNLGAYGVDQFTGVIALGQTSLLTVGRAAPRVVADNTRTLRIRTSFFATLNVDHRVIDGAAAARLLAAFAAAAEAMTSTF